MSETTEERGPTPVTSTARDDLMARMSTILDDAVAGRGRALRIAAPVGTGVSELLATIATEAEQRNLRVLRVAGAPHDLDLAWDGLARLCAPIRRHGAEGPRRRARALAIAFDGTDGSQGEPERRDPTRRPTMRVDRLDVFLGVLGLLADIGAERPTLVVVDDLHWLDFESRAAIDFIGQRLGGNHVALVVAGRGDERDSALPTVHLAPPTHRDLDARLLDDGVSSSAVRRALIDAADGNPLHARALAWALDAAQRSGTAPLGPIAPVDALHRSRVAALGERTRDALLTVAALGEAPTLDELAAADVRRDDLLPALGDGIVVIDAERVVFTHPLLRAAAYHDPSLARRRRVHARIAVLPTTSPARAVLHHAAGIDTTDRNLAVELAELADDALGRGAALTASERLAQASDLVEPGSERVELLLRAVRASLVGGDRAFARRLVDVAAEERDASQHLHGPDPVLAAAVAATMLQVTVAEARYGAVADLADHLPRDHAEADPRTVADALTGAARALLAPNPDAAARAAEHVLALTDPGPGSRRLRAEILHAVTHPGALEPSALDRRWRALLDAEGPVGAGDFLADTVVGHLAVTGRLADAFALLDELEPTLRRSEDRAALVAVLVARGRACQGADLPAAVAALRQACELGDAVGAGGLSVPALALMIRAASFVGDHRLLAQVTGRAIASGEASRIVCARVGRARTLRLQDRPEAALDELALLRTEVSVEGLPAFRLALEEVPALVALGRVEEARAVLATVDPVEDPARLAPFLRMAALVAEDDAEAADGFDRSIELATGVGDLVEAGLSELAWADRLLAGAVDLPADDAASDAAPSGDDEQIRFHLARAVELFAAVGASELRRRAGERFSTVTGVDRPRSADEVIGSVELQVARLAAAGVSDASIAEALFVDLSLIERVTEVVCQELAVADRAGLVARARTDASLRGLDPAEAVAKRCRLATRSTARGVRATGDLSARTLSATGVR